MKANPYPRRRAAVSRLLAFAALSSTGLAACVPPPPSTPPASVAPRPAAAQPAPVPAAAASPAGWRDAPATPGTWSYGGSGAQRSASFSGGFALHCDMAHHNIQLARSSGQRTGPISMTITTSAAARALPATPASGAVVAALSARDPLLDAMAFSNGRFAVTVPGEPTLYIPSWTEVSALIEDCR